MEALRVLPKQVKEEVNEAIVRYGISEELIKLKATAQAVFNLIKADIDRERENEERRAARSERMRKVVQNRYKDEDAHVGTYVDTHVGTHVATYVGTHVGTHVATDVETPSLAHVSVDNNNIIKEEHAIIKEEKKIKKESGKKETTKKPLTLKQRQEAFYGELTAYVATYGKDMVRAFYDYWSEPNQARTKMRREMERTWDTARRLGSWERHGREFTTKQNGNGTDRADTTAAQRRDNASDIVTKLFATNG